VLPQEQLFRLEIDFHRRLRVNAPGTAGASSLHTSYALQSGYERLIRVIGTVTAQEFAQLCERFTLAGDARDLLAAGASRKQLLGMPKLDG
jgi:hypothetical protein